jgi:hypothetical protein
MCSYPTRPRPGVDQREGCHLTLWPRSLFGRLALLLLLVILISQATAIFLPSGSRGPALAPVRRHQDCPAQGAACRARRPRTQIDHSRACQVRRSVPGTHRPGRWKPIVGGPPQNPVLVELPERLKSELGPETDLRIQPRLQLLWIKLQAGETLTGPGFNFRPAPRTKSSRGRWDGA